MRALAVLALVFAAIVLLGGPGGTLRGLFDRLPPLPEPAASLLQAATPTSGPGLEPSAPATTAVAGAGEIVLSEAEVNRRIGGAVAQGAPVPVQDLQVRLLGQNTVSVSGVMPVGGASAQVTATLALRSGNGTVDVEVQSAQAGPVPLPGSVVRPLLQQALRSLGAGGPAGNQLPAGIERVEVRPGQLVLVQR